MINVALPKGRLGERALGLFAAAGCCAVDGKDVGRRLTFCDEKNGMNYFWVKPSDVSVYVERGAADIGVVGKDVLDEELPDVYELMDLNIGKCSMCVAAKSDFKDDGMKPLRVATKFVRCAEKYFGAMGRKITVIKLNGSVELAPILGLADVIFDIVETGATLKANGLCVLNEVYKISARFIANKAAYKFKYDEIKRVADTVSRAVKND